jgi:hypothetical protein
MVRTGTTKTAGENVLCVFPSRLEFDLLLLSAGKKISFNGIKQFNGIIYGGTETKSESIGTDSPVQRSLP